MSPCGSRTFSAFAFLFLALLLAACGKADNGSSAGAPAGSAAAPAQAPPPSGGLTPFQLENGIGPITTAVTLGPIDPAMAKQGQAVFEVKCSACHKMGEKYVGPALGDVTTRRTPAYILNMILNPAEMTQKHPVAQDLMAQHMTQMPNQGLTPDEARQVLEYLRTQAK